MLFFASKNIDSLRNVLTFALLATGWGTQCPQIASWILCWKQMAPLL